MQYNITYGFFGNILILIDRFDLIGFYQNVAAIINDAFKVLSLTKTINTVNMTWTFGRQ